VGEHLPKRIKPGKVIHGSIESEVSADRYKNKMAPPESDRRSETLSPIGLGYLNEHNRLDAVKDAVKELSSRNTEWVLGMNECNTRSAADWLSGQGIKVLGSTFKGRTFILTNMKIWERQSPHKWTGM